MSMAQIKWHDLHSNPILSNIYCICKNPIPNNICVKINKKGDDKTKAMCVIQIRAKYSMAIPIYNILATNCNTELELSHKLLS